MGGPQDISGHNTTGAVQLDELDQRCGTVMDGRFLIEKIIGRGSLPLKLALSITAQVLDALAHAHEHGVLHRDLKPSNIILAAESGKSEEAKIVDFGVAKLVEQSGHGLFTQSGVAIGSPAYMSPEQCLGCEIDARSDLYAVGCVLYEMVTGAPPLVGATAIAGGTAVGRLCRTSGLASLHRLGERLSGRMLFPDPEGNVLSRRKDAGPYRRWRD